jgi:hypothetical protein
MLHATRKLSILVEIAGSECRMTGAKHRAGGHGMAETEPINLPVHPISLTGHTVPPERLKQIAEHVAGLSRTALEVSDNLCLGADASDFTKVLEKEEG